MHDLLSISSLLLACGCLLTTEAHYIIVTALASIHIAIYYLAQQVASYSLPL